MCLNKKCPTWSVVDRFQESDQASYLLQESAHAHSEDINYYEYSNKMAGCMIFLFC